MNPVLGDADVVAVLSASSCGCCPYAVSVHVVSMIDIIKIFRMQEWPGCLDALVMIVVINCLQI